MKILMVTTSVNSQHAIRPLKWLLKLGYDVYFVSPSSPINQIANFKHIILPELKVNKIFRKKFFKKFTSLIERFFLNYKIQKIYKTVNPDLTHIHYINHYAKHFIKNTKKPVILSVWGSDINNLFRKHNYLYKRQIAKVLSNATLVITDDKLIDKKCKLLTHNKINSIIVHLGINFKLYSQKHKKIVIKNKRKLSIPLENIVLFSPRLLSPIYQHETIIHVFAKIHKLFPKIILLLKLPSDNPQHINYYKKILRIINDLNINSAIRWIPWVDENEWPTLYSISDLIINYPCQDTIPILFLEASACKKHVISFNLESYRNSLFAEAFNFVNNEEDLEHSILDFLNKKISNNNKLEYNRKMVKSHYNESNYIRMINKIYESYK